MGDAELRSTILTLARRIVAAETVDTEAARLLAMKVIEEEEKRNTSDKKND